MKQARRPPLKDPIYLSLVFLSLALFCVSVASRSIQGGFLGKSNYLWIATVIFASASILLIVLGWKLPAVARGIKRISFVLLYTVLVYEVVAFFCAGFLPVNLLMMTPEWTQRLLPDGAFDRKDFRVALSREVVDDPDLGYHMAPNLDFVHRAGEISYRLQTDSHGFANADESLYGQADIVATGDSFTMGATVEQNDSWPRQLSRISGMRLLNLATMGWDVYQYPRVLERYAPSASPDILCVSLIFSDLKPIYYEYQEYRAEYPETPGYSEYRKIVSRRNLTDVQGNYLKFVGQFIAPFSRSTLRFITGGNTTSDVCEFSIADQVLRYDFKMARNFQNQREEFRLQAVAEDLARITEFARENGSKLYFVYLPSPSEIYIPLLGGATNLNDAAAAELSRYESGAYDFRRFVNLYLEALGKDRDRLLDATSYLQEFAARGEDLAWTHDFHPNAAGHFRIAEFVARHVVPGAP